MPRRPLRLENARVRPDRAEDLQQLIDQLFARRHHEYVAGPEHAWLTVELVQSLRRQSVVYRTLSTTTEGPLPFALGYLRVRDDRLEPISDAVPVDEPEMLARLLSEFVQPGARVVVGEARNERGWIVAGEDELAAITLPE